MRWCTPIVVLGLFGATAAELEDASFNLVQKSLLIKTGAESNVWHRVGEAPDPSGDLGMAQMQATSFQERAKAQAQAAIAPFACLPIVLAIGLAAFIIGGRLGPYVPTLIAPYLVCVIYVLFSVAIDLSIAIQKRHHHHGHSQGFLFNPVCAVLLTEVVKFFTSSIIYTASLPGSGKRMIPKELTLSDAKWMFLPALIFTANNILVFQAIGSNDMSAFGVFRDTMILWTAAMWRFVFRSPLGWTRLAGIFTIFLGLVINKAFSTVHSGTWSWMFLWVIAMTLCNAAGSVANEYALKHNKSLDINVQNMVLYGFCVLCSMIFLACTDPQRYCGTFFNGFGSHTWITIGLQSFVGLLVSRLLKYTDAVMKTVATCLRGPVVVIVSPFITSEPRHAYSIVAALVVATGCFTYLTQGPMSASANAAKATTNTKAAKDKDKALGTAFGGASPTAITARK